MIPGGLICPNGLWLQILLGITKITGV